MKILWRFLNFSAVLVVFISPLIAHDNRPPKMPTFTESTVRQMLDSIDEGHNFSLLRAGYFGGHRKSPFPVDLGFDVLKSTLAVLGKGSDQWFMLQALRASAAFHTQEISAEEGFNAYDSLFSDSIKAQTPRAKATLRSAVRDFVGGSGALKRKDVLYDSRVPDLLVKAWNLWQELPRASIDARRPLDWGRAVEAAYAQDKFADIVEDALKDKADSLDFETLKLAVVVLQNGEPERAIELLKTAQQKMQSESRMQQKWLYETWTQLITGRDPNDRLDPKVTDKTQLDALAEMHKGQISYNGTGYADLLKLYWKLNQQDKANDLIKVTENTDIRASEKIEVAKVLLRPARDLNFNKETLAQLQQQGVSLLQEYLTSENRDLNDEIRARYELGRYYLKQDKITEAQEALNIGGIKVPPSGTHAGMYYQQIERLKAQLAQKLEGIPGAK